MKNKLKTSSGLLLLFFILSAIILFIYNEYFKASIYLMCSGSIILFHFKPLESTENINKKVNTIIFIITIAMLFISVAFILLAMFVGNIFALLFINNLTKINDLIFSILLFFSSTLFLLNLISIVRKK